MQARPRLGQVQRRPETVRTPGEAWPDVRRIAVVRNDRLGDVVLTVPAVAALRAAYPSAWLGLLVRPPLAPLGRMVRVVDEVLEDPGARDGRVAVLRAFRPDALVSISPGGHLPLAGLIARIPHRVGPGYRIYTPLFERHVDEHRSRDGFHEVEYALSYAHRSGAPGGTASFPLGVPDDCRESLRAWLDAQHVDARYVVLHPGSGGSCPSWPPGHFVRLATLLRAEGWQVVVSLGPDDAQAAAALDGAGPAIRRLPRFTGDVPTLAACLLGAALVVSNSTGPLHLAAALGTPTLAFHAPWPSCGVERWGPYAANGWALVAELDEAGTWSRRDRSRRAAELMATISPATALSCCLALLEGHPPFLP